MAAREAFSARGDAVDYRDVRHSRADLDEMLRLSQGRREVPVIVEDGRVSVGYGGT